MDYCSSCRRYLNGALVCPGCGAYAPDIAPSAVATTSAGAQWEFTAQDKWQGGRVPAGTAAGGGGEEAPRGPGTEASDGGTGAPPAPQGRAARRRQLARLRKNQRRAVIATAVALVGGGLTVATMGRDTADRAQAATAPHDTSMGAAEEQALEDPGPPTAPPRTHRSAHTAPARSTQSPAAGVPPRESAVPHRTAPGGVRPAAAASPRATATSVLSPQVTAPSAGAAVPGDTATAAQQAPAPAPTGGTSTGTPSANPTPAPTSPSQICLLHLVCLG
ncbi:hypothetical protein [Streptomyces sp. NPDC007264]|uniref:SCO2400 family protein n=1 Tax=Streptomyces sp. NPDC007264 TaxID=3364777 RepID=UPI0036DD937F